jgi:mRNA interferase MazF
MNTGDIVIVSFPFTNLVSYKARPAVVIAETPDEYKNTLVSLITSVVPPRLNSLQIRLPYDKTNNLKVNSVIKVYRIATIKNNKIIAVIGKLNEEQLKEFKDKFKSLVAIKECNKYE